MGQTHSTTRHVSKASVRVNTAKGMPQNDSLDKLELPPFNAQPETKADQSPLLSCDSKTDKSSIKVAFEIPQVVPCPRNLQDLPAELLVNIGSNLSPSSTIALSNTCRRIRLNMNVSIEQIWRGTPARPLSARNRLLDSLREQSRNKNLCTLSKRCPTAQKVKFLRSERLSFLCMLERDRQIGPMKALCSVCVTTHHISLFSPDSLDQRGDERECLGRVGRIWICPHWSCDYEEARGSKRRREGHICGALTNAPKPFVGLGLEGPTLVWPLIRLDSRQAPPISQVAEALQPLALSICPHWRMNDHFVLRHYSPNCENMDLGFGLPTLRRLCQCAVCLWRKRDCPSCGASISFHAWEDYDEFRALKVMVTRKYSKIKRITDPAWIKQLAYPHEFEVLEQAWNASARHSERALGLSSE